MLFEKARNIITEGVSEALLAKAIGAGGLLLRVTIGSQFQLLWFALQSDGRQINLVAQGSGGSKDLEWLRWASARHDFRLALVRFRKKNERFPGFLIRVIDKIKAMLNILRKGLSTTSNPESLADQLTRVSEFFLAEGLEHRDTLMRFMAPILRLLSFVPEPRSFKRWAPRAKAQLRRLEKYLLHQAPGELQPELDRITADYIDEVSLVWRLDSLNEVLSPETDLVIQVDDALHTVPIAHLPVAGEPLFRRIRSVRSSLALLMTSLQLEIEKEVHRNEEEPVRLLSVCHFKEDDHARKGAVWLQHGFSVLAQRYGYQAYGAADNPAGSAGLIRTALESLGSFKVLAVCGHGHFFQSGIELAGGQEAGDFLWEGGGCDLSGVDWLWMVSCSIGRLGQNGDRDVEGFCVRLALHRARSVAAFRWPVHSLEAVALVNESVRLYLEALESAAGGDARCLRARALNDARKNFFGDGSRPPLYSQVGLNTAAACELFGLG